MKIYNLKNKTEVNTLPSDSVLCLGNFDGVHLGHRVLISECISYAKAHSLISGAWLFENAKNEDRIFSNERKLEVFSSLGLDFAICYDFSELRDMPPEDFVYKILKAECRCVYAVCGENFRFGQNASGDKDTLFSLMKGNAHAVPLVMHEGNPISSTRIRALLGEGKLEEANTLLGENYSISGEVVHGKALGRTLGLPTVNITLGEEFVSLKNGIYITLCTLGGNTYKSVTNVGIRPTVENTKERNSETHILGFSQDCYGEKIKVEFLSMLRGEKKFSSVDELKAQILTDIESTKKYFEG